MRKTARHDVTKKEEAFLGNDVEDATILPVAINAEPLTISRFLSIPTWHACQTPRLESSIRDHFHCRLLEENDLTTSLSASRCPSRAESRNARFLG